MGGLDIMMMSEREPGIYRLDRLSDHLDNLSLILAPSAPVSGKRGGNANRAKTKAGRKANLARRRAS